MIQIIIIVAGIYVLVKRKIDFSKTRELVKPKSIYIGIALIIVGILSSFIDFIAYGLLIATVVISYFLSQKKVEANPPASV
jgi:hypothetical protein